MGRGRGHSRLGSLSSHEVLFHHKLGKRGAKEVARIDSDYRRKLKNVKNLKELNLCLRNITADGVKKINANDFDTMEPIFEILNTSRLKDLNYISGNSNQHHGAFRPEDNPWEGFFRDEMGEELLQYIVQKKEDGSGSEDIFDSEKMVFGLPTAVFNEASYSDLREAMIAEFENELFKRIEVYPWANDARFKLLKKIYPQNKAADWSPIVRMITNEQINSNTSSPEDVKTAAKILLSGTDGGVIHFKGRTTLHLLPQNSVPFGKTICEKGKGSTRLEVASGTWEAAYNSTTEYKCCPACAKQAENHPVNSEWNKNQADFKSKNEPGVYKIIRDKEMEAEKIVSRQLNSYLENYITADELQETLSDSIDWGFFRKPAIDKVKTAYIEEIKNQGSDFLWKKTLGTSYNENKEYPDALENIDKLFERIYYTGSINSFRKKALEALYDIENI